MAKLNLNANTEESKSKLNLLANVSEEDINKARNETPYSSILSTEDPNSKYRTDSLFKDQEQFKAEEQTNLDKWANGIGKMAGTAITSAIEPFADLAYGMPKAIVDGKFSSFYDNEMTQGLDHFNEFLQKELPNYYTKEELNNSLIDSAGTANFWSDKVLNGLGFALGSIASSYITMGLGNIVRGRTFFQTIPKLSTGTAIIGNGDELATAMKLAKNTRIKDGGQLLFTNIIGALGESGMEARSTKEEIFNKLKGQKEQELQRELTDDELSSIESISGAAGNVSFGLNLALVGGSNFLQFGKLFNKGYQGEKRGLNSIIQNSETGLFENRSNLLNKATKVGKALETNFIEGTQEQLQYATQKGVEDYVTKTNNKENQSTVSSMLDSTIEGLKEAYGTKEGIEQGLIGSIIGSLTGGNIRSIKESNQQDTNTNNAIEDLNAYKLKEKLKPLYDDAVRQIGYQNDKNSALREGDQFAYQNAQDGAFKSYVKTRIDTGEYESFLQELDNVKGLSSNEEEFKKVFGFEQDQPLPKDINNFVEGLKTKAKEINKINSTIETNFGLLNPDLKDYMFDTMTSITDINRREEKLSKKVSEITKGEISYRSILESSKNIEEIKLALRNQIKNLQDINSTVEDKNQIKDNLKRVEELKNELERISSKDYNVVLDNLNNKFVNWAKDANPQDREEVLGYLNDLPRLTQTKKNFVETYNSLITKEGQANIEKKIEKKRKDIEKEKQKEEIKKVNNEKKQSSKEEVKNIKDKEEVSKNIIPNISEEDNKKLDELSNRISKGNVSMSDEDLQLQNTYPQELENKLTNKLTKEEVKTLEVEDKINETILEDGEFYGLTSKEKTSEKENIEASLINETPKGKELSPQGLVIRDEQNKIIHAHQAISYLTRNYSQEEEGKKNIDNELNSSIQEPDLLSHYDYQVGTPIILEVDRSFNIVRSNGNVINYQTLKEREIKEGKDNLLIPIAIKNTKGKTIGYLHDIDWINEDNVANKDNNIEIQKEKLSELRNKIINNGGKFNTKIISKSYGNLSKSSNEKGKPFKRGVKEAFPDPTLKFAIPKRDGLLYIDPKIDLYTSIKGEEELINSANFEFISGAIHAILPTPIKGKSMAIRLDTKKISSEYSNSILYTIEAFYNNNTKVINEIKKISNIDISDIKGNGLKQYINLFIYSNSFNKESVYDNKGKENVKFLDIINGKITFAHGGGIIRSITGLESLTKNKEILKSQLEDSYQYLLLDRLGENKTFSLPIVDKEEVKNVNYLNYIDFIKDSTETTLNSYQISKDEWAYFDQPTVLFDSTSETKIKTKNFNFSISQEETKSTEYKVKESTEEGDLDINFEEIIQDEDLLPAITPDKENIIRQSLDDILIPGLSVTLQNEIIDFLATQINDTIEDKKSIEEVYKKWYKWFDDNKDKRKIILEILKSWDKLKKFSFEKVARVRNLKLKEDFEVEGFEDIDNYLEKTNFDDEGIFQIDPKDTISNRLKAFFSFIPTGVKNGLGLPTYMSGDEVMNNISAMLANTNPDYVEMRGVLEDYSKSYKWLKSVNNVDGKIIGLLPRLDRLPEQLKNEFVAYASKHYAPMKMVFIKNEKDGISLRTVNSDQYSISKTIIEDWLDNQRQSNLVEESKENPGELKISKSVAETLRSEFTNIVVDHNMMVLKGREEEKEIRKQHKWKKPIRDKISEINKKISDTIIPRILLWVEKTGVRLSEDSKNQIKNDFFNMLGEVLNSSLNSRGGTFNLMASRLLGSDNTRGEGEDLLYYNNPLTDNSGVRRLAKLEATNTSHLFSNSFKNAEGKTVYSYSLNKYFTNKFRELTTNSKIVDDLLNINFSSTSSWLKALKSGFNFEYFYFDGLKKVGSKQLGVKLKNQSGREHEITKLALFFNQGSMRSGTRIANYLYPTMSDKTTMIGITGFAHETKVDSKGNLGNDTLDVLSETVEGEYKRIRRFQELKRQGKEPKIDGYNVGAEKFIFYPELNDNEKFSSLWAGEELLEYTPKVQNEIKEYLKELVKSLSRDKIKEWEKLGIVTRKDNKLKPKFIDKIYLRNIVKYEQNLAEEEKQDMLVVYPAFDYTVNYLIANANAFQMFIGDPALFWKSNIDETLINIGKRLAKEIAPGIDIPNSNNNKYRQVLLADRKSESRDIEYLSILLGENEAKEYTKIEGTDAQEYTTLEEHLYLMKQLGKITPEQYDKFLSKGEKENLSLKDLSIVLQAMKPVYSENIIDLDNDVNRTVYIKSSSFPLIPQLTKGLEIDKLRVAMEKGGISRAAFKSATKVGGSDYYNIWTDNGNIKNDLFFDKYLVLPRSGFRIQQEVPFDSDKDKITKGTQETKLLFVNLRDIPEIKELEKEYDKLHHQLYKQSSEELDNELLVDGNLDINKLKDLLKKEAIERGYPLNDIQALDIIDGKFKLPLWASSSANKIESLLNSIVDNKVRKRKMKGFSGVLASEEGFIGKSVKGNIVWMDGYNPEEGLRIGKNGSPSQIIAPFKFKDNEGNLLNLQDFIIEKDGRKIINKDKLPDELLKSFAFRIPTQGHNSMSYVEVVGFIPYEMGDLTIVPREFTKQMGSDFDIDKIYIYQYNTFYKNGKLSKYKTEENNETNIQNRILDIHIEVFSNNNKEVQKQIYTPLGFGKLQELGNKYKDIETTKTLLSDSYQKRKYINATQGKMGTATFALDTTFNASLQVHPTIDIKEEVGYLNFKDSEGNIIEGNKLSDIYTVTGNRKKSEIISGFLSAHVDNEKEQIAEKINSNGFTFDAIRAFNQQGIEEDYIVPLLVQPIIKEYVEEMKKAKDSTIEEFIRNPKNTIPQKIITRYLAEAGITEKDISKNEEDYLNGNYPLSIKEMDEQLKNPTPLLQVAILTKFIKARNIGSAIQQIQSTINTDSKGFGKNLFESLNKEQRVRKLFTEDNEYIKNSNLLIGELSEKNEIVPTTINGFATVYGLFKNNELWKDLFPYGKVGIDSVFKEISLITNKSQLSSEDQKDIWDNIKSFIYTREDLSLTDLDIEEERRRLLYDITEVSKDENNKDIVSIVNKSFATRWKEFKNTNKGKRNAFAIRTTTEINRAPKPSLVKYNASAGENLDELNIYKAFVDGLLNNNSRELFQDAVLYFYLTGGIQEAVQFGKYVPISYLNAIGFSDNIRNIDFDNEEVLGTYEKNNYYDISEFTKQYFQNNPSKAPRLKEDLSQITGKLTPTITIKSDSRDLFVTRYIPEVKKQLEVPIEFVSIYDSKKKNYRLFQYVGNYDYKEISTFTNKFITEYNSNIQFNKNINSNQDTRDKVVKKEDTKEFINTSKGDVELAKYKIVKSFFTEENSKIETVLKAITENTSNMWHNTLANQLLDRKDLINDIRIDVQTGRYKGSFNNATRNISISPKYIDDSNDLERTLLHETLHGMLNNVLTNPRTDEQKSIVTSLERSRQAVIEKINANPEWKEEYERILKGRKDAGIDEVSMARSYGAINIKEFVTMSMTDREFQSILNNISFSGEKTFWDRFLELITKMLNTIGFEVKKDSILEQAIHDVTSLINITEEQDKGKEKPDIDYNKINESPIYLENGTYYSFLTEGDKPVSGLYSQGNKDNWESLSKKKLQGTFDRVTRSGEIVKEEKVLSISNLNNIIKSNGKVIYLNEDQINSLDSIEEWIKSEDLFYTLKGFAGTGKSTIAKEVIRRFKKKPKPHDIAVSAPTHKAKKVIAKFTGEDSFTIQGLLGLRPNTDLENFNINNPQFDPKAEKKIAYYNLIVIDEASMLNKDLYKLLIDEAVANKTKILFMGDPAQLPPIKESTSQVFVSKSIDRKSTLSKVERQTGSNPLMKIYDSIRNDIKSDKDQFEHDTKLLPTDEGIKFYKGVEEFTKETLEAFRSVDFQNNSDYAKILSWTNLSVKHWNNIVRKAIYGEKSRPIEEGEILFSYSTVISGYSPIIENSAEYKASNIRNSNRDGIIGYLIDIKDIDSGASRENVFVVNPSQENYSKFLETFNKKLDKAKLSTGFERGVAWRDYYEFKEKYLLLEDIKDKEGNLIVKKDIDYGYAITIHKSQGSTYNRVFILENVIDQNPNIEERNKLKYVALSRPSQKAIVLSNKTKSEENTISDIDLSPMINRGSRFQKVIEDRKLRVDTLSREIVKNSSNREKRGELIDKKKILEQEIKNLENEATLKDIIDLGNQDLREVTNILSQDKLSESDLFYVGKILGSVEKYLENLFTESDLEMDEEGQYSGNVKDVQEIVAKANTLKISYTDAMLNSVLKKVNEVTNNNYNVSDILIQNEINALSANFLDISRTDNILMKVMDKLIRDSSFATNIEATNIFNEVDDLIDKIKKNKDFREHKYKLFAQKNKDGSLTGNIVNPYSQEFYNEKSKQLKNAKNKSTQKAWNEFFAWKRKNEIVFDVRKLFNSYYIELGGNSYSDGIIQEHINLLKKNIGDKRYSELYSRLENKIKLFKEDYEEAINRYSNEEDEAIKASLIDEWLKENSPFYYAESVYSGTKQKVNDKFIIPRGYRYTYEIPRKIDSENKATNWYDKDFEKIESNEDLYSFYRYMLDTFDRMYSYLPESKTEDLQYNYLPEVKKTVMELFNERGLREGFTGLHDSFIEAITINELSQNRGERSLPIYMVGNKISPEDKSYDMGNIIKTFSVTALSYKHKSKVEDSIRLIQTVANNSLERQVNGAGEQVFDKFGNPLSEQGLKNTKEQLEYAIDAFYGQRKKTQGITGKKAKTIEEKKKTKEIDNKIEELKEELSNNKISEEEYKLKETPLLKEKSDLGKNIVGSRIGDQVLKYIQIKGMGWNYFNAVTNTLFGFVSNAIEASGGQYFTMKNFMKANSIMLNSTLRSASGNNYSNKTANKINKLMSNYIVISELYENTSSSSLKNNRVTKGIRQLAPYEAQKRAEYFNQGSTFVALMLSTNIKTKDNKEISLWEAYDNEGNWKSELFDEEITKSWNGDINDMSSNKDRKLFKGKLEQLKKSIHGNYDPDSPTRIKSGFWGRSLIQFRSWVAEGIANRFEEEKEDLYLGIRKGRYRTYGIFYKNTDGFSATLRLFAALISKAGREELSDVDKANMKKNAAELALYISLMSLAILTKSLSDDDDDDESKFIANFMINQAMRLQTDITFYTSPIAFEKITRNSIPAFGLIKDVYEFGGATRKYVIGEDELRTGPYKGTSRITREFLQLFPFGQQIYGQYSKVAQSQDY